MSRLLTLYSNVACPFAARAVIAMAETQQAHDLVEIDLSGPRPDWYLKDVNPQGQVPALKVDDKAVVLESLVIAEYIADLHPESGLLSKDPLQRAQTRYLIHHWGAHARGPIHFATVALDAGESAKLRQNVITELEKVDTLLRGASRLEGDGEGPFFLGEKFTFADLSLGPFLARLSLISSFQEEHVAEEFEASLKANANLKRFVEWRDAVVQRPSVQKATPSKEHLVNLYRNFLPKTDK